MPGPGIYQPQNDLSNEGKYVLSKNVSAGKRTFMDGRRLSFTDLVAKRSGSKSMFIKPLGQVVIALLLILDTMIAEDIDKWGFLAVKYYQGLTKLKDLVRLQPLIENEIMIFNYSKIETDD